MRPLTASVVVLFWICSMSANSAQPAPVGAMQCIEGLHLVLFRKAALSDALTRCSLPEVLPPILATDYDIRMSIDRRRARVELDLTADEQTACYDDGLVIYRALLSKVRDAAPVERSASSDMRDFMFSVLLEAEITEEGARRFFSNPVDSGLCLDPFFVAAVLRTRNAAIVVSESMLGALSKDTLSESSVEALWLAVLHADNHPQLQHEAAGLFVEAAKTGRFPGKWAASLVDRLALADGHPQSYGTLYDCEDGRLQVPLVFDPDRLDDRRAALGLTPYAHYVEHESANCDS